MWQGFIGPQGARMEWESFPRHAGWGGDGVRQNHMGRRWRSHPSALPCPIVIPIAWDLRPCPAPWQSLLLVRHLKAVDFLAKLGHGQSDLFVYYVTPSFGIWRFYLIMLMLFSVAKPRFEARGVRLKDNIKRKII